MSLSTYGIPYDELGMQQQEAMESSVIHIGQPADWNGVPVACPCCFAVMVWADFTCPGDSEPDLGYSCPTEGCSGEESE